jgi:CDP-diacylglycerol--serine O-phosphatidyltransferase
MKAPMSDPSPRRFSVHGREPGQGERRLGLVRGRRIRPVPLRIILPNLVTLLALSMGLTGIRFAIEGQFQIAVLVVIIAAVLDGLDGRLARALRGTTRFGAELDSLADFVDFGVAPGLILYLWNLHQLKSFGWFAALVFAIACALRLARFNVSLDDPDRPSWEGHWIAAALSQLLVSGAPGDACDRAVRNRLCPAHSFPDGKPHSTLFGEEGRPRAARICDCRSVRHRGSDIVARELPDGSSGLSQPGLSRDHPPRSHEIPGFYRAGCRGRYLVDGVTAAVHKSVVLD